jgi:hypothetical protein
MDNHGENPPESDEGKVVPSSTICCGDVGRLEYDREAPRCRKRNAALQRRDQGLSI